MGVYDTTGATIESTYGVYKISLVLSPTGVIDNYNAQNTALGVTTFTNLRIVSAGSFSIIASSPNIAPATSSSVSITNFLYSIKLTATTTTPAAYQNLTVIATGYSEDGVVFPQTFSIAITESSSTMYGVTKGSTAAGVANFLIRFSASGIKTVIATSGTVTSSIQINVAGPVNADPKCVIGVNANTCSLCVENAQLFDGICSCAQNSTFSITSMICVCDSGFTASNNYCVGCADYFRSSEITGRFSTDFSTIYILFARIPVAPSNCASYLIIPSSLSTNSYQCSWIDPMTLAIYFNTIPPVTNLIIGVDPVQVHANGSACTLAIQVLQAVIAITGTIPVPISTFTAPSTFSLVCSTNDLSITAVPGSYDYVYTWSSSITPASSSLTSLISGTSGAIIVLPLASLVEGTIQISLRVSSKAFGTSSTSTKKISVVKKEALLVSLSSGSALNAKSTSPLSITAYLTESCGGTSYTYAWSYLSSTPALAFSSILSYNSQSNTLYIAPSSLSAGYTYEFGVTVTENGGATGSSAVQVYIQYSDLELALDRSSGQIGTDVDFVATATVVDPDNSSSVFSYIWSCTQSGSTCLDSSQNDLLIGQTSRILTISKSKLSNSAVYYLTLTVSTSTKTASISLQITVVTGIQGTIMIGSAIGKLNVDVSNTIVPTISNIAAAAFSWSVEQGGSVSSLPSAVSKYSYLSLPAYSLSPGTFYELLLTMTATQTSTTSTGIYSFTTNAPPVCSSFTAKNVTSAWALEAVACVDGDNADYPLSYQFGTQNSNGVTFWLSATILLPEINVLLPASVTEVVVNVCDSLQACTSYVTGIAASRRLTSAVLTEFIDYVVDPANIPNGVMYYAGLSDGEGIQYVYNSMQGYFSALHIDRGMFSLFLDCMYAIYANSEFTSSGLVDISVEFTAQVIEIYNTTLDDSQIQQIFRNIDKVVLYAGSEPVKQLLQIASYQWITPALPGAITSYNGNLIVSLYRIHSTILKGSNLYSSWMTINFPTNMNLDSEGVYDVMLSTYYNNSTKVFDLSLNKSGSYSSYTLSLSPSQLVQLSLNTSIYFKISGQFNEVSDISCVPLTSLNWTYGFCDILSADSSKVTIDIAFLPSLFKIQENAKDYTVEYMCMFLIFSISGAGLVIILVMLAKDKLVDSYNEIKSLQELYSVSSMMIAQGAPWRSLLVLQLVTSETMLLAFIGAYFYYFSSTVFSASNIMKSGVALLLSQSYTISCIILNFNFLKSKLAKAPGIVLSIIIYCMSVASIVFIMIDGGYKVAISWLASFMLWSAADIFVVQFIYAMVLNTRKQINIQSTTFFSQNHDINDISIQKMFEDSPVKIEQQDESFDGLEVTKLKSKTVKDGERLTPLSLRGLTVDNLENRPNLAKYQTQHY